MTLDIAKFKERLEKEEQALEGDLGQVGRVNPQNKNDWEVTPVPGEGEPEMHDEVAGFLEDLEERKATEVQLEKRLNSVKLALEKISAGTYGTCHICNKPIEIDRLEINPTATTCKEHREEK